MPFLFKQWGEWVPVSPCYQDDDEIENNGDPDRQIVIETTGNIPIGLGPFQPGRDYQPDPDRQPWIMERVGKKAAGRLLDGVEHNGFPTR